LTARTERAAELNALITKCRGLDKAKDDEGRMARPRDAPRTSVSPRRPVHGVHADRQASGPVEQPGALQKVPSGLMRAEKAGHTGTLDPLASGLLPLCFGAATKFSQIQLEAPKTYEAVALLGVTTTTGRCGRRVDCRTAGARTPPSGCPRWCGSSRA
jgi:hypothetical protein